MGDSGKGKSPHADLGPAATQVTWKAPLREELPERRADQEPIRKLENTKKMKTSPDTADYGQKPTGQAAWADTARPPGDVDQNPGRLLKNPTGLPRPRDLVTGCVDVDQDPGRLLKNHAELPKPRDLAIGCKPGSRPTADEPHLVLEASRPGYWLAPPAPQEGGTEKRVGEMNKQGPGRQGKDPQADLKDDHYCDMLCDDSPTERACPVLKVKIGSITVEALYDSGANKSLLTQQLKDRLTNHAPSHILETTQQKGTMTQASGDQDQALLILGRIHLNLDIQGLVLAQTFRVVNHCGFEMILGMDFITAHEASYDAKNHDVVIKGKPMQTQPTPSIILSYRSGNLEEALLPANTSVKVAFSAPKHLRKNTIVEVGPNEDRVPSGISLGTYFAEIVSKGRFEIFLQNHNDYPVVLPRSTPVVVLYPLETPTTTLVSALKDGQPPPKRGSMIITDLSKNWVLTLHHLLEDGGATITVPGGKYEADDVDTYHTALREAYEELGSAWEVEQPPPTTPTFTTVNQQSSTDYFVVQVMSNWEGAGARERAIQHIHSGFRHRGAREAAAIPRAQIVRMTDLETGTAMGVPVLSNDLLLAADWAERRREQRAIPTGKAKIFDPDQRVEELPGGHLEEGELNEVTFDNTDLTPEQQQAVRDMLAQHPGAFVRKGQPLGHTNLATFELDTQGHPPIKQRPYRASMREQDAMTKEIETMLKNGVIEPSTSAWSSPVVMVRKPDGSLRWCV